MLQGGKREEALMRVFKKKKNVSQDWPKQDLIHPISLYKD